MKGSIGYTLCRSGSHPTHGDYEDEFSVTIDYTITPIIPANISGPPEDCYPAEGGEVDIVKVKRDDNGEVIDPTACEEDCIVAYIQDRHEFDEVDES